MTAEAKAICERMLSIRALLEHGPLDTIQPRQEVRMSAESAKSRFEWVLVELKMLPMGVARTGA